MEKFNDIFNNKILKERFKWVRENETVDKDSRET